jgi:hypothetical protein
VFTASVNAVELGRIVEVGQDILVTMCPLMGGRTRLLPDEELDQRHSMCDLAPLGLSVPWRAARKLP